MSSFDPFLHGEITEFPQGIHFGQDRIAPNFSSVNSQAADAIAGRSIAEVASDLRKGLISPDLFVISYTKDPLSGKFVTLNNRGLAALAEGGKRPQYAVFVPYEKLPSYLVSDIKSRASSLSINITEIKNGSGVLRTVNNCM